jgi:hypothetical protein
MNFPTRLKHPAPPIHNNQANALSAFNRHCCFAAGLAFWVLCGHSLRAQTAPAGSPPPAAPTESQRLAAIEDRLRETQAMLEKSLLEIQELRVELNALRAQPALSPSQAAAAANFPAAANPAAAPGTSASASVQDDLESLHESQDALQAEVKQHEQTKVETASKYPLRVSGLVLFNAYSNAGVVDDAELPTIALSRAGGSSHGSLGATLRQTLLELEATGPTLAAARSSASVSIDFFGDVSSNGYGYSSSSGLVRMRQAQVGLDWNHTTAQIGFTGPLITPLSPTSFATVAQPALAGSGNLWTWSPQLRVEQRIPTSDRTAVALEAGLISPQSPGYTSVQLDSPIEASRRPGYEGRISYRLNRETDGGGGGSSASQALVFGVGGYSASQFYNSATQVHAWAVTADLQAPVAKWLQLTGEAYRGDAIGGLGGGEYKDTLTGADTVTGLIRTVGVEDVGGWGQLKFRRGPSFEANAVFGLDDALSGNFYNLVLSTGTNPLELYARNRSVVGNLIFRPKTYLILSPEYRRLSSWRYTGPGNLANIFTLTAAYQF